MITLKGNSAIYECVSTDSKPTTGIDVNTLLHELDTDKWYYFKANNTWGEVPNTGGGGSSFEPTQSQLDAMNSGATTEKINQIETNKNNISLIEQMNGAKNYINYTLATLKTLNTSGTWADNVYTLNNVTFTVNTDMTITVNGTPSATANFELCTTIKSGGTDMIISAEVYNDYYLLALQRTGSPQYVVCNTGAKDFSDSSSVQRVYIQVRTGEGATPPTNARFKPMITDKTVYNAGFTDFQPYAMTNAELTAAIQAIQAQLANS